MMVSEAAGPWSAERRFPRRRVNLRAALFVTGDFCYTDLLQISEGGLLFKSDRDLDVGSFAELHFFVDDEHFITVRGEVIYKVEESSEFAGRAYGLRFLMLKSHDKVLIRKLVSDNAG